MARFECRSPFPLRAMKHFRQVGPPALHVRRSLLSEGETGLLAASLDSGLSTLEYPVAVNLSALVALRRSSWPFVDKSFFFCLFSFVSDKSSPRPAVRIIRE